ncbi:MAG: CRISPR system precrRNA processing endoribonuclease RAMP protein Cas6 [Porphyromonas sp.]|nr:CRISPR system precrRNA processing endoribonuclease RAMP protein Cas6 [Porphyromonas sp.]
MRFLTPTTLKVDQVLTREIPYTRLMNRLSRRLYLLYTEYLSSEGDTSFPFIFTAEGKTLHSHISMPNSATIKEHRHYDMAGILGQIVYQVPYDPVAAVMLSIAQWVHIGSHTVSGNGRIKASDAGEEFAPESSRTINTKNETTEEPLITKKRQKRLHKERSPSSAKGSPSAAMSRSTAARRASG